jgi:hypothetical protein
MTDNQMALLLDQLEIAVKRLKEAEARIEKLIDECDVHLNRIDNLRGALYEIENVYRSDDMEDLPMWASEALRVDEEMRDKLHEG